MFSSIAENIYRKKYALSENETWEKTAWRVAYDTAKGDKVYGKEDEEILEKAKRYYNFISEMYFVPGGRILSNAGTKVTNRANCFFLEIEDSRESIYETLKDSSEIFAWGGGLGIDISRLREEGAFIKSTGGNSSGAISFLELFNLTGDIIQQASRRAAMIAVLDISHPDILKFINYKAEPSKFTKQILEEYERNLELSGKENGSHEILTKTLIDKQLSHFNISVMIPDSFMEAVEKNIDWEYISPSTEQVVGKVNARKVLDEISEHIWENGDPGIIFTDRVNEDNMVPYVSNKLGPNPCSEIFLIDGESCVLGSLNLHKFYDERTNSIDYELLESAVRMGINFLDNIHDISETKVEKINITSMNLRRLGLGVMGWADLLAELELGYDSKEAMELGNYLSWFISIMAWQESLEIAEDKGYFNYLEPEELNLHVIRKVFESDYTKVKFDVDNFKPRNVSVTALAPTGSISLISDVNSSIEPYFALAYKRNLTEGESNIAKEILTMTNPILLKKLIKYGYTKEQIKEITKHIINEGSLQNCDLVNRKIKKIFVTSHDIPPTKHIEMQANWQEYISNAISKTINVPHDFTKRKIYNTIINLWKARVKSSTIYRDGSRFFQILNLGK